MKAWIVHMTRVSPYRDWGGSYTKGKTVSRTEYTAWATQEQAYKEAINSVDVTMLPEKMSNVINHLVKSKEYKMAIDLINEFSEVRVVPDCSKYTIKIIETTFNGSPFE